MKKLFIVLLAAFVFAVVNPTKSEAKVMYDGAEVVKGQTGKMTFKKDIKVYKKNSDGTFESLVVKRNNFFKTYDIEKYDGKIFYQMGQYRVQATDLVVFKEVPIEIRSSFYNNPTYIIINRDGNYGMGSYGFYLRSGEWDISFSDTKNGQLITFGDSGDGSFQLNYTYPGTDLKIAETISRERGVRYELTRDEEGKGVPLKESKTERIMKKGSTVFSRYDHEINGYIYVTDELEGRLDNAVYLPMNSLKPVGDK
ncbi:hypothetical protein [Lysinibacillus pakistanensis]|uniref:Uncharacterized protein n=1 Tax=Lysinibacillus pakistanensis TaxID=759811 RepID=A0AAX3WVC7_9BACI|nr:hypothetical protein [Lysinibacillus pakistanensis]MDM5229765.1 hypothetical protein [Lysinibacillus pakistanensis]WHY45369.1 hypothetical protein QNH22_18935 [Lysinibacillus pakistanensis]WHY50377.1 hypothetical protein QNH24_18900 [Lysinibacillus pakistanensis]